MGGPGERTPPEAGADIVIVTALGLERDAVTAGLTDSRDVRGAGTWFVVGTVPGSRARVATGVSGAGNSAAAAFTTQAIELFRPAAVLVVGVAGALHTDLRLGDVVVASRVYAYHGGRDEDDGFKPAAASWAASHELLQLAGRITGDEGWRVLVRPIAAGEVVQDSRASAAAAHLRRHFSSSAAIEMESAGVAEAAHRTGTPLLVIRGISDAAADGTKTTADATGSQPTAAEHAASVAHEVIRAFRPSGTPDESAATPAAADATYSYGSFTATNVFQGPTTIETFKLMTPPEEEPPPEEAGKEPPPPPEPQQKEPDKKEPDKKAPAAEKERKSSDAFDDLRGADPRAASFAPNLRSRSAFLGTNHIGTVVVQAENNSRLQVLVTELEALHAEGPFVTPPGYEDLTHAVTRRRVVVCAGPAGSGRDRAVTRALLETGHQRIRMLPPNLDTGQVAPAIKGVAEQADACVVHATDAALQTLMGKAGDPVRSMVAAGQATVVVVTSAAIDPAVRRTSVTVELTAPDAAAVVRRYATDLKADEVAATLMHDAVAALRTPPGPAVVAAIADEVLRDPGRDAGTVAALFDSSAAVEALGEWIAAESRSARDVAALAAAVTLFGRPAHVVHHHAEALREVLEDGRLTTEPAAPRYRRSPWPDEFVRTGSGVVGTHFGRHTTPVVQIRAPYQPHDLAHAMWETLGEEFRIGFGRWLLALPAEPGVRFDAAYTAGVLFALDPVAIENRILRPWALDEDWAFRWCAGLALGAPFAIAADPAGARQLAHHWSAVGNERLQEVAVTAYAGPLGVWDVASTASSKLVEIGYRTPELRELADEALAQLVVAGTGAVESRYLVLGTLRLMAQDRNEQERVFGCLPRIVTALTADKPLCRESRAAIQDEPESWAALTGLVGDALLTPRGLSRGVECLEVVVRAIAAGDVEHEFAERLVRGLKTGSRANGTLPRLGTALRRVLVGFRRTGRPEERAVANALLDRFFGPGGGQ